MSKTNRVSAEKIMARLKAGDTITVRAKNGQWFPKFSREPSAYRCTIGKQRIEGATVLDLLRRHQIAPVVWNWYTEGYFQVNKALRDERD